MKKLTLCVAACLLSLGLDAQAITGPETARLLNSRYQAVTDTCTVNKPAWYCSGVLVRAHPAQVGQKFWEHGSDALALGAESLVYLRSDLSIRDAGEANGVVFSDLFTAVGAGQSLEVLCAYPFALTLEASRAGFGCALPTGFRPANTDPSSCTALNVTDSSQWIEHFASIEKQPEQQCSLSATDALQFAASVQAHQGVESDWSARTNQLQVRNWDAAAPLSVPVQALFYDTNKPGALLPAQQDQRDFFNATGQWLPVLRMDLNDTSGQVFGFNLQDQLYVGYAVAARMNARYADTRSECPGGLPAYYCNGVLFRSNAATTAFHAWNPSPGSTKNNGVSFSYARQDLIIDTLVFSRPFGFTFKESAAPAVHSPAVRCAYPYDAGTSNSPDPCTFLGACEALGITSVALWLAQYAGNPGRGCAFDGASAAQFQLSIEVRNEFSRVDWNEIMVAAWPQDIPQQLPLETLFHQTGGGGLPQAQFIQNDYFQQTQRFLPLVEMNLAAPQGVMFTFAPADQLSPGAPSMRGGYQSSSATGCASSRPTAAKPVISDSSQTFDCGAQ